MIAHRLRRFGCQAFVPIIRMQAVTDFNFICSIDFLMKEAAVTDQSIIRAAEHGKLLRQTAVLPRENFLQKGRRLFACFAPKGSRLNQLAGSPRSFCSCHSANRGTFVKELPAVGGFGDIFLAEWSQN
jgi:hypothetical protein